MEFLNKTSLGKHSQDKDRSEHFPPNWLDQEQARLSLAYILLGGYPDSQCPARGLKELLQELQLEQELR